MTKTENKKKRFLLALKICFAVFGVFAVGVAMLYIISPNSAYKVFGMRTYLISYTKSMEPKLNYNDAIFVKKYNFDKLKTGDIVTYSINDIVITHEVVDIKTVEEKKFLITKGINLDSPDTVPVTVDGSDETAKYIGKYAGKSVVVGNMIAFFKQPIGIVTLVLNASGILAICIVFKWHRKKVDTNI